MTNRPLCENGSGEARSGIVAVVGRANVGKSSLINHILGEKVSIVSPVVQTTRNVVRGFLTEARGQLVFLDTPGIHKAQDPLGKRMNQTARSASEGVDVVMLVLDGATAPRQEDKGWIKRIRQGDTPCFCVLNKKDQGASFRSEYEQCWETPPAAWFSTSAKSGVGVEVLVSALFEHMLPGPALFPEDIISDFPRKLMISDFIREKYLHLLHEELPHAIAVRVENIEEQDKRWRVKCLIYVQRHSQKGILIGHKGRMLRKVKRQAERELSEIYEQDVRLDMNIKIEKDWQKNYWILKQLGHE